MALVYMFLGLACIWGFRGIHASIFQYERSPEEIAADLAEEVAEEKRLQEQEALEAGNFTAKYLSETSSQVEARIRERGKCFPSQRDPTNKLVYTSTLAAKEFDPTRGMCQGIDRLKEIAEASAKETTKPNLRIAIVCGSHARELYSTRLCEAFQARLEQHEENGCVHDTNTNETTRTPHAFTSEFLIVPLHNPLGRDEFVTTDYANCKRANARGVDLNRNWPAVINASVSELPALLNRELDLRYENPGPFPLSEDENRAVEILLDCFVPDIVLLVHTGGRSISTPGEFSQLPFNYGAHNQMAHYIKAHGVCKECPHGNGALLIYPVLGTMADYYNMVKKPLARRVPFVLTFEVYGPTLPLWKLRNEAAAQAQKGEGVDEGDYDEEAGEFQVELPDATPELSVSLSSMQGDKSKEFNDLPRDQCLSVFNPVLEYLAAEHDEEWTKTISLFARLPEDDFDYIREKTAEFWKAFAIVDTGQEGT